MTFDEAMQRPKSERFDLLLDRYETLHEHMGNRTDREKFEMAQISDAVMMTLIRERWVAQQDCVALRAQLVPQTEENDRLRSALEDAVDSLRQAALWLDEYPSTAENVLRFADEARAALTSTGREETT